MKRILSMVLATAMLFCLIPTSASAMTEEIPVSEGCFPDAAFREEVRAFADTDRNGTLSPEECLAVTQINVEARGISSLEGIGYFENLTELNCSDNPLNTLDLSGNPRLKRLHLGGTSRPVLDLSGAAEENPALSAIAYQLCGQWSLSLDRLPGLSADEVQNVHGGSVTEDRIVIDGSHHDMNRNPAVEFEWQIPGREEGISFRISDVEKDQDNWFFDGNGWKYYQADGSFLTGQWLEQGESRFYFDAAGYMVTGWLELDGSRYYMDDAGHMMTGWIDVENERYYLGADGAAATYWLEIDGHWYYFDSVGRMQRGWQRIYGDWYHLDEEGRMETGWQRIAGDLYYLNGFGHMQTGWQQIDGSWYYFNASGHMQTGWQRLYGDWYYLNESGRMLTGWQRIGGIWFYFNDFGHMQTGWQQLDGQWYYLNESGHMLTGWQQIGGIWFYFNASGHMQTGWQRLYGDWYYLNESGHMMTGWQRIAGSWYYFNASGHMQTGWAKTDGGYSYFNQYGHMQTGWLELDGETYYLSPSGYMATGWTEIGAERYYFDESGRMLRSTWIGDRYVTESGCEYRGSIPSGSKEYYVAVNTRTNSITVLRRDDHGSYTIPYRAMICSSGLDSEGMPTPTGSYRPTGNRWKWLTMVDDSNGLYVTQFKGNFLFHSVPYQRRDRSTLCPGEFDKLGQDASHGCVRLQVKDAKWIYDHMWDIDMFYIYESDDPGPLGKPTAPKIDGSAYPGWDPTDPHPDNPWHNAEIPTNAA